MTQDEFANLIGYTRSMLARAEAKNTVSDKMLFNIEAIFPDFLKKTTVKVMES